MADFCRQCSEDMDDIGLYETGNGDLEHLSTPEDTANGLYAHVICEGCSGHQAVTLTTAATNTITQTNTMLNPTSLIPLGDRVLIEMDSRSKQVGSLYIPDTAQDAAKGGIIVALGEGYLRDDNTFDPITNLAVGDRVVIAKFAGHDFDEGSGEEKREYAIVKVSDVLAKVRS